MRSFPIAAWLVVALGMPLWTRQADGVEKTRPGTTTVLRGDLPLVLEEEGELQAATSISVGAQTRGTITFIAPEGSKVKKGDVLIELDTNDIEDRIRRHENDLETVQKRLKELRDDLEIRKDSLELEIEKKRTALEVAEIRLQLINATPLPEDLALAQKNLENAQLTLEEARRQHETTKSLFQKQYATKVELDKNALRLKSAEVAFRKQKKIYGRVARGPDPFTLKDAELVLAKRKIELEKAELARDAAIPALEESIGWEEANLLRTESRVRDDRERLEHHKTHAPADGTVVLGTFHHTNEKFQVGNRVWPGICIIELPDTSRMKIRSKVPESAASLVDIGKPVTVLVETIPGEEFPAKITWIDRWARDRNADLSEADREREGLSGTMVFDVEAELDESDRRLKMGLKARMRLAVRTLKDVVHVDRRAVRFSGGEAFVVLAEGPDRDEKRPVALGAAADGFVVVSDGLEAGEKVLLK